MADKNPQRPVTTRDVAEAAGVNQSTVSRALRGEQSISKKTRAEIERVAKKLGYRPNPFVSAFTAQVRSYRRSPQVATIALVNCWPATDNRDFIRFYREGIDARATELGFRLDEIYFSDLKQSVKRLVHVIRSRGIRGILILPVPADCDFSKIDLDGLAAATIDISLKRPNLHRAVPHYFQAMQETLTQLERLGNRRIAFCSQRVEMERIGHFWMGAYLDWQRTQPKENRLEPHVDMGWDRDALLRWIDRERPDAIVANENKFFYWMKEAGISVPDQVAFATLGRLADDPHLAGINQNFQQVGAAAFDLVVGQIFRNDYGLPDLEKSVLIEGTWVSDASVTNRRTAT